MFLSIQLGFSQIQKFLALYLKIDGQQNQEFFSICTVNSKPLIFKRSVISKMSDINRPSSLTSISYKQFDFNCFLTVFAKTLETSFASMINSYIGRQFLIKVLFLYFS